MNFFSKHFTLRFILIILISSISFKVNTQNIINKKEIPFKAIEYKLNNGLTVILSEDKSLPLIFGVVAVNVGSKNDPNDATGLAHYQEHLLFKGTEELGTINWEAEKPYIDSIFMMYDLLGATKDNKEREKIQLNINRLSLEANKYVIPNELSNLIKEIGGTNLNAGTGNDGTIYYSSFPSNKVEHWLEIYSHIFSKPVFRSFQAELEVVYEEKNLYNDVFIMPLFEKFGSSFFKKHPYGQQSIIGTVEHLKNPSLTKMYEFFKTWYVPNNMALILCGDFNIEEIKPIIQEKFGKLKYKELPEKKIWQEEAFKGKEKVTVKMSPIKLALYGYRTPPAGHKDEAALEVLYGILSNSNSSGLLDKLVNDNKLLAAQFFPMAFNDYGAGIILMVPKIIGQSFKKAEKLIFSELELVRMGEFDDWLLDASKNDLYVRNQTSIEGVYGKAMLLAGAFSRGESSESAINYPEKIKSVTKEDIVRVANEYFNKDFLSFYSKMGFPKKEKIAKPDYKPVLANNDEKSTYASKISEIKSNQPRELFFDFKKDVSYVSLKGDENTLIWNNNPYNDIFSMNIRYNIGSKLIPLLKYAANIMNYAGTISSDVNLIKEKFSRVGCSYSISCDDNYLEIEIEGIEENIDTALSLINEIINFPIIEKSKINILVDEERTSRKMESSEPDILSDALLEYIKYNDKSSYIDRLTINEIKNLKTDSLIATFKKAVEWEAKIFYTGKETAQNIKSLVEKYNIINNAPRKGKSPEEKEVKKYSENTVYLLNKKNSLQSKINFIINGKPYNIKDDASIKAFNLYFGGDFSGLVLQEIREYRSLAYSAGAYYNTPKKQGYYGLFEGYIGTQADKTITAIEVFDSLVRSFPIKEERLKMLKEYLSGAELSNRPTFRKLGFSIDAWKQKGYTDDPLKTLINEYRNLKFDVIIDFYERHLKNQPMVIAITGDIKRFDKKSLERYGKIIEVEQKQIFRN